MEILVLGGTGQIGLPLAKALVKDGHHVTITGRDPSKAGLLSNCFLAFDPANDAVTGLPKSDVIINCIGTFIETESSKFEDIHFRLVQQIIEHQDKLRFQYFIQLSALGADTKHSTGFLSSKGKAEETIRARLQNYSIIRPSICCTPGTRLIYNLAVLVNSLGRYLKIIPMIGTGKTLIQPIALEDLVDIFRTILNEKPLEYSIDAVGPRRYSLSELSSIILATLRIKALKIPIPKSVLYAASIFYERIDPMFLSRQHIKLLNVDNTSDPDECVRLLSRPLQSVDSFLRDAKNYGLNGVVK